MICNTFLVTETDEYESVCGGLMLANGVLQASSDMVGLFYKKNYGFDKDKLTIPHCAYMFLMLVCTRVIMITHAFIQKGP